ncbi:hypothetical protein D9M68_902250 [compost metagenome]
MAVEVVGGVAAFQVDGAVGQQRNARGRRRRVVAHLQLGQLQRRLYVLGDFLADFHCVADRLLVAVQVGERDRGLGMAEGNHAGFLDLVQPARACGVSGGGAAEQGGGDGDHSKCFHLIPLAPDERRMLIFTIGVSRPAGNRLVPR